MRMYYLFSTVSMTQNLAKAYPFSFSCLLYWYMNIMCHCQLNIERKLLKIITFIPKIVFLRLPRMLFISCKAHMAEVLWCLKTKIVSIVKWKWHNKPTVRACYSKRYIGDCQQTIRSTCTSRRHRHHQGVAGGVSQHGNPYILPAET